MKRVHFPPWIETDSDLRVVRKAASIPGTTILRLSTQAAVLLAAVACGTSSTSARPQRTLEVTAELATETGLSMAATPLEITIQGYYGATPKVTDPAAHWSAVLKPLHHGTGWWIDPLLAPAPLPRRLDLAIRLAAFEPEAVYPIQLRPQDEEPPTNPPYTVLPRIDPHPTAVREGQTVVYRHADAYCPVDGWLRWATLAKLGHERMVPPVWDDLKLSHPRHPIDAREPNAPRLAITARLDSLAKDRDRLSLEIRVVYFDHE